MANAKARNARPRPGARSARPLLVGEVLTLCGGNRIATGRLFDECAQVHSRGDDDLALHIMRAVFTAAGNKVSPERREAFFKGLDNNDATRILRKMAKDIGEGRVQPFQIGA
jgi:hypothetical protein